MLNVIFVHGLGGHPIDTWSSTSGQTWRFWQRREGNDNFWPHWLSDDLDSANVWSLGYPAAVSRWFGGNAMAISRRAANVLEFLRHEQLGDKPIAFIVHSLGGLVIKEVLRSGVTHGNPEWKKLAEAVRGILFLATPHSGSRVATIVEKFRITGRPSVAVKELRGGSADLENLNNWYVGNADDLSLVTRVLREEQKTKGVWVVDPDSADPGMTSVSVIPIDADHAEICKPQSRNNLVYKSALSFVHECARSSKGDLDRYQGTSSGAAIGGSEVGFRIGEVDSAGMLLVADRRFVTERLAATWRENSSTNPGALVHWRTRSTELVGRQQEIDSLEEWCDSPAPLSVQLVYGTGGVGKSRLAAELVERMRQRSWVAGRIDIEEPRAYRLTSVGNLFVIDYAEERISKLSYLLGKLGSIAEPDGRLRILLLTRRSPEHWSVELSAVEGLLAPPMQLMPISDSVDSYRLFCVAREQFAEKTGLNPPARFSQDDFEEWKSKTLNSDRPLFVLAYAYESLTNSGLSGGAAFKSILNQEYSKWKTLSGDVALYRAFRLVRFIGSVNPGLTRGKLEEFLSSHIGGSRQIDTDSVVALARQLGEWRYGKLLPIEPDLLCASFVHDLLFDEDGHPIDTLAALVSWTLQLSDDLESTTWRLSRIAWDCRNVLQSTWPDEEIAKAVVGKPALCEELAFHLPISPPSVGLLHLTRRVWQELSSDHVGTAVADEAVCHRNLAKCQLLLGDHHGAAQSFARALEVWGDRSIDELDVDGVDSMTASLKRAIASLRLDDSNSHPESRATLSALLNSLSIHLLGLDHLDEALTSSNEAANILAALYYKHGSHEAEYAATMNNRGKILLESKKVAEALRSVEVALAHRRKLVEDHPELHSQDIAVSYENKAACLRQLGEKQSAVIELEKAVAWRQRLSANPFGTYRTDYLRCLESLVLVHHEMGDESRTLSALEDLVSEGRRFSHTSASGVSEILSRALYNRATLRLKREVGKEQVLEEITEAEQLITNLTDDTGHVNRLRVAILRTKSDLLAGLDAVSAKAAQDLAGDLLSAGGDIALRPEV